MRRGLLPVLLLVAWQMVTSLGIVTPNQLRSPGEVFKAGVQLFERGLLVKFIAISVQRVLVAQGGKLLRWDRTLTELAHVDQRIVGLWSTEAGVLLELTDHAVVRAPLTAGAPLESVLGAAPTSPLITGDHRLVVGPSVNGQVVVVETATRARWELPAFHAAYQLTAISPSTRRLVELNLGTVVVWSLPLAPPELRDWLDARTNALTDADHALVWPWQPGAPTR